MVSTVYSFRWGNLSATSLAEYHFPCTGSCLALATWNKGMDSILVWHTRRPKMVLQIRGSWTSGWMSLGSAICKSFCSNNGAWYGWHRSTLNTGCITKHEGMSSWKVFSPKFLRILYRPYHRGLSFLYGLVKRSFFRWNQTWSLIWNEWGVWCWSCLALTFSLAHWKIYGACF